jgi:putative transposase
MSNKTVLAQSVIISRRSLYYVPKQPVKDWITKQSIELVLRDHPSYGHKRLAIHLGLNKKRILRVMKLFGIKPYRRVTPKQYTKPKDSVFPNLLITETPLGIGDIYASDFTYLKYQGQWVYVATVIDIFTREIVGVSVLTSTQLVLNALANAVLYRPPPRIVHSDQGSEYTSKDYTALVQKLSILQSMSNPGCPWENGYQESSNLISVTQIGLIHWVNSWPLFIRRSTTITKTVFTRHTR